MFLYLEKQLRGRADGRRKKVEDSIQLGVSSVGGRVPFVAEPTDLTDWSGHSGIQKYRSAEPKARLFLEEDETT